MVLTPITSVMWIFSAKREAADWITTWFAISSLRAITQSRHVLGRLPRARNSPSVRKPNRSSDPNEPSCIITDNKQGFKFIIMIIIKFSPWFHSGEKMYKRRIYLILFFYFFISFWTYMSMSIRNNIFNLVIVSLFSWRQTKKATLQLLWSPWYLVLLFLISYLISYQYETKEWNRNIF